MPGIGDASAVLPALLLLRLALVPGALSAGTTVNVGSEEAARPTPWGTEEEAPALSVPELTVSSELTVPGAIGSGEPSDPAPDVTENATARSQSTDLPRLPTAILELLETRNVTLPAPAYSFDGIATGTKRYPEEVRYLSLMDTTLCHCRHRCLADVRCMGFEHETSTGVCGLTDVLLPGSITTETTGEWSTYRRRGISWLEAPCHDDRDCSLLVGGARCGPEGSCVCPPGWSAVTGLLCRPDGRWVMLNHTSLEDWPLVGSATEPSLQNCQDSCRLSVVCLAIDYTQEVSRCRQYATPVVDDADGHIAGIDSGIDIESNIATIISKAIAADTAADAEGSTATRPANIVSYIWEIVPPVVPPSGYSLISGRFFRLTEPLPSTEAAAACLRLGGVPHTPDDLSLLRDAIETLTPSLPGRTARPSPPVGVGANDILEEGRFDTVSGSTLKGDSALWAPEEPNNQGGEHCVAFSQLTHALQDVPCRDVRAHLCEHLGTLQVLGEPIEPPRPGIGGHGLSWWSHDLGRSRQVSRVLYLAKGDDTPPPQQTELRVGQHPSKRAEPLSSFCTREIGTFAAPRFARVLKCGRPLTGQYLFLGQKPQDVPGWDQLAVILG